MQWNHVLKSFADVQRNAGNNLNILKTWTLQHIHTLTDVAAAASSALHFAVVSPFINATGTAIVVVIAAATTTMAIMAQRI